MVKAEICRGSQGPAGLPEPGQAIALLKRQIAELEKEIRRIVAEDADLANKVGRLESVKGIGWLTAATALAELPWGPWAHTEAGLKRSPARKEPKRHVREGTSISGRPCTCQRSQGSERTENHSKSP